MPHLRLFFIYSQQLSEAVSTLQMKQNMLKKVMGLVRGRAGIWTQVCRSDSSADGLHSYSVYMATGLPLCLSW